MARPEVTEDDERWAHRFLCLSVPFEALSSCVRAAVTATARALAPRLRRRATPAPIDFKRRAAGDIDD